jgi:autotransporter-associated beta strand protein
MRCARTLTTLIVVVCAGFAAWPAAAADKTWRGTSGSVDNRWSTANNWDPPGAPAAGDSLHFSSIVSGNVDITVYSTDNDLPADTSFFEIFIDRGSYILAGNRVVLTGSILYLSSGNSTISLPIQLSSGAAHDLNVADGTLTLSGVVSGCSAVPASCSFSKSGVRTLTLSGDASNTYGATTTVTGGTLVLAKSTGAIAVPGNLVVEDIVRVDAAEQIADSAQVMIGDWRSSRSPTRPRSS